VFENRVLRKIFGPKRNEVTRGWRKLHNEKFHNLYSSPSKIIMMKSRRMRWAGHGYRMFMGKPEGKIPLGRPGCRWVDNITINLREIRWDGMDWIDLVQNRDHCRALVNTVLE
jgi:hypothetical protein